MKLIKNLTKSKFAKNVVVIAGGTAFAQALTAALSPIITRIYSPEDYGSMTIFLAVLSLFSLGALMYEKAIPISENDEKAVEVLTLSFFVLIIYSSLIALTVFIFGDLLLEAFNAETILNYSYLIPIGVFLVGLYNILKHWAFREKNYKSISSTTVVQSLSGNFFKIMFGLIGIGPLGLILGTIISQSSGATKLSKPIFKNRNNLFKKLKLTNIISTAKRFKDFPIFNVPVNFIRRLGDQLPVIFITSFFGVGVAGYYGLAFNIIKTPLKLIGSSVANVFYSEAASIAKTNPKRIKQLSRKLIWKLFLVGLIPFTILILFGPFLFKLIFGQGWEEAGVYARIISIMLLFNLVFSPVSRVYEIYEKQKLNLLLNLLLIVMIVTVFGISLVFDFSAKESIFSYAIVKCMMSLILYIVAQRIINEEIIKQEGSKC